jgi:LPXTG-motif cell wall-anchored protein
MKRFEKAMAIATLGAFGILVATSSAVALPYAPAPTMSIVGCSDVDSGIAVQITGLRPGSTVTIAWPRMQASGSGSTGSQVTASEGGSASATLPTSKQGDYSVTADGVDADGTAWTGTANVTVVKSCDTTESVVQTVERAETVDTPSAAGLPKTGGDTGILVALGAGAILFGGAAVVAARRGSSTDKS